jgi:hypothetical protein
MNEVRTTMTASRDEPIRPMTLGNMRQNGVRGLFGGQRRRLAG